MASQLPFVFVLLLSIAACASSAERPNESGNGDGGTGVGGAAGSNAEGGSSAGKASSGAAGAGPRGGSESPGGGGSSSEGGGSSAGSGAGNGSGGNETPDEPGTEELGFTIRKPGPKNLDWLCSFDGGHVYARLLQTGTKQAGIAEVPVYEVERAQLSLKGEVSELANAEYDYGGGHHNDSLSFDYDGKTHRFYHSSFGFGFRACQPMDCRNVYELGSTTLEEEGCASSRTLPEVCVTIEKDGTHAPLEDKFMKCAGSTP